MDIRDNLEAILGRLGVDLTAFTLLPFGGAGAVHAAAVAEELRARTGLEILDGLGTTELAHIFRKA